MTTAMEELVVTVTPRNRANFRRLKTNSIQSVKRWEKENELLYAMMEDESEWLAKLFPDVVISPEFFFYALEDGSLLCRLANYIQEKAELYSQKHNVSVPGKKFRFHTMSKCGREIKLFRSRENVQQFLIWCRSHGLPEAILFESNDVVQVDDYREGCRGVIICLMEIVRRTAKFDLDELPQLIQMEKEIEEDEAHSDTELSNDQGQVLDVEKINNMTEIDNLEVHADQPEIQSPSSLDSDSGVDSVFDQDEGDNTASRLTEFSHEETEKTEKTKTRTVTVRKQTSSPKPKDHKGSPKKGKELPSLLESTGPKSELDKQVCKIAQDYNIKIVHRLKEGKYIILGRVMFVRMLNDHMLVRIGGGWDTLEHYLMTHAPSKEALEVPSTPSSQAVTSPRNSISAASGVRTSLFERVKRKEQVGIVNRDSAVYSSQGSLNQQLGAASSPKIRDKGKRESLKDEKDITDAIRKISTSVSQTLAERPVSFTNKSFHQLKSRFDKGIFGAARRTSSPDLTLKGDKIRRRLSDTPRMADVETTLAFDGEQVPVANNNDTESKQPENAEEQGVGKVVAPTGDLLGDASLQSDISTPEDVVSDETDSGVPVGDLLSMETSNQSHLNGDSLDGQVNGGANFVDVSSFDPFAAAPQQSELLSTSNEALHEQEEQPMSTTVVDNGALAHEEQSSEAASETTPESSPRVELGDLLRDAEPDSTLDASPRPVDLGDLLLDSETTTEQEKIDVSPVVTLEEEVPLVETVPESQTTEVEEARSGEPVADEDVSSNIQEVPSVVVGPTTETLVESKSESLKVDEQYGEVGHFRDDEPVMGENMPVSVSGVPPFIVDPKQETLIETEVEPPKPDEEFIELEQDGPDEPVMNVDIPTSVQEDNPPLAVADSTPETPVETTEVETPKPEEASTPVEKTVEEQPSGEKEPSSHEESVLETHPELPNVDEEFGKIEETTHSEEPVVEKASELHEIEGKPVNLEEPAKEEEPANVEEPFSGEEAVIKSEGESTEAGPEVDATTMQEGTGALASDVQVAEREPLKADEGKEDDKPVGTEKVEKASDKGAKSKPAAAIPKSPPKAGPVAKQTSAKKPTGAARPTSPIKAPISAPVKKDVKASVPRAPASKPAASKAPASMAASAKKPAAKPATTKVDERKKPEKPKSAAATRPSSKTSESKTQGATRPTSSSTTAKKPLYSTTAPSAAKAPSKGVKDAGPTKSTPKTTTTKPPSAKPAATKTASSATKPAAAKPTRTQSAKPVDSTDSGALAKKPMARPQSAKPKVTTTTTTVKKTTTSTTTKVGAGPVKSQTTTTKTVTQSKGSQPKSSTTTSTTTKTTAKPGTRPPSAAVKKAGTTGAKSKTGGQPGTGAAGGKSATKCAPKKKAEKPAEEKEMKQEEKTPEPTTAVDEKPTEVVETSSEVVETVVKPPGEASPEDKSNELTPDSAPVDQTTPEVEEASEEIVEQFSVVTHVVTAETTVIKDGEEQSTTTTEETTFEQSAES